MAWDDVEFLDRKGKPVARNTRDSLLRLIERALMTPDVDPDVLINTAAAICENAEGIKNLPAYANRSILRAVRKAYVDERKRQASFEPLGPSESSHEMLRAPDENIEQQILISELIAKLNALDREIYTHHLNGLSFLAIDKKLSLRPRTSEYRFREAQARLRQFLANAFKCGPRPNAR